MTNFNGPAGLVPIKHFTGGTPQRLGYYSIIGALASNIFRGSLVKPASTTNGKNIDVVAAGAVPSIGVFKGCNYVDAGGNTQFQPKWLSGQTLLAGTVAEAQVYDDPDLLFDVQVSGASGLQPTNIGNTANILIGTGSPVTGTSADQLDQSTLSASSTTQQLQVQELRLLQGNTYGQYARALVTIFLHVKNGIVTAY